MQDYYFRSLQEEDLDQIAQFECEIAANSFGDEAVTDLAFHRKRLSASVGKQGAIIAETDTGEIAGWALVSSRKNATSGEVYGDFRSFYIASDHRGGKLAFSLISEVIDYGLRNEWARLVGRTAADNKAMQAIYRFFQFEAKHIVYELPLKHSYDMASSNAGPAKSRRPRTLTPNHKKRRRRN